MTFNRGLKYTILTTESETRAICSIWRGSNVAKVKSGLHQLNELRIAGFYGVSLTIKYFVNHQSLCRVQSNGKRRNIEVLCEAKQMDTT